MIPRKTGNCCKRRGRLAPSDARTLSTLINDLGITQSTLAKRVGRSRSDVANTMRLLDLPDEGNTHITKESDIPDYKTNPPTSGNHNPTWVADGAYLTPLRTNPQAVGNDLNIRNFVHSMEHGRVEIQYSSKLPEDQQLALKGVFDEDSAGMLLYPNDDMPADVAVTAWRQLLTCPSYSPAVLDAIRDFRDIHRGQAPENVPINL